MPFRVLLCFNGLDSRGSLVAFLIHHIRLAAVPLHFACLPTVSQISDARSALLPCSPLTRELSLPTRLLDGLILTRKNPFSHRPSQSRMVGVQGQRRAHSQMSLGVCYASEIRVPPDIHGLNPPPGPANSPAQDCGCFHLEIFLPCCVASALTMDSLLLSSLICLWHADLQKAASQTNKLHFTPVHLQKLSSEVSTPFPTLGKNAWEMVDLL